MARQPSFRPIDPSSFFPDGTIQRPLPPGTIARGHLQIDSALFTGRKERAPQGKEKPDGSDASKDAKAPLEPDENFVDAFPIPINEQVLQHGRDRYMIYCVVCHDVLGTGQGKIVERGYTPPPSYHIERLRKAPVGRFFAVISEGYGSMPSYATQIPPRDRWAIAAYIRAIQLSQHYPAGELSDAMHREWVRQTQDARRGGSP
jgi:mono/diheme cytochrome c family protein